MRSLLPTRSKRFQRSRTGITRSLHTMVESAMVSTITMPVAAEMPPTKTRSVRPSRCCDIGSVSTKLSGSTLPCGKTSRPPKAMGSTKTLMASMYAGNSHIALRTCRSSTFSITATWNWRGRNITASIESSVIHTQLASAPSAASGVVS